MSNEDYIEKFIERMRMDFSVGANPIPGMKLPRPAFLDLSILVGEIASSALLFVVWFGLPIGSARIVLLALKMRGCVARIHKMPTDLSVLAGMAVVGDVLLEMFNRSLPPLASRNS